ncbi:MAG: HTH-type transcriptional regulator, transcriptional repressor of biosynthesis s [Cryptosporangiaceae bacterium]|jgi:NadR type nicotinamide-nucleotide adenylyltransferase|nr:HTH-type transcriptional regulator, transcriptional repressor of biosynthesis s [Cryptosporangiaceae bacterium]
MSSTTNPATGRAFRHGLVIGKFYPPHAGHDHLIRAALRQCGRVTVVACASAGESIPLDLRVEWLRAAHPSARIAGAIDDHPIDYGDPAVWELHCAVFRHALDGEAVDAVFSSEAYGSELARRFGATAVSVDPDRGAVPVSGTAVRADPVTHWHHLGPGPRSWLVRRIVVVGAESTGTTTLSRDLAVHYRARGGVWAGTRWVPEYGRALTLRNLAELQAADPRKTIYDIAWTAGHFAECAREQDAGEEAAARSGSPILICDTDSLATAIWEERYLGSVSPPVAAAAAARRPALYLLTGHEGVPFEDDGIRDGEHLRPWMTGRFRAELAARPVPHLELSGGRAERLARAVEACDAVLAAGWRLADPLRPRDPESLRGR